MAQGVRQSRIGPARLAWLRLPTLVASKAIAPVVVGLVAATLLAAIAVRAAAGPLDDIGVTALRAADPTLDGSGIAVIQAEANVDVTGSNTYQVDPTAVNWPSATPFTYIGVTGVILNAATYTSPNSAGSVSWHSNTVGYNLYGRATSGAAPGVAPNVASIDNYNATYYYNYIIAPNVLPSSKGLHDARIVNQSFIFDSQSGLTDRYYDDYAADHNVLFVNGIGNGPPVVHPPSPASAYNGIAVAAIDWAGTPTVGPTSDGRSKPDITAPGGATSYSTPYVSGTAAVLMQAAARNDGGTGTASAAGDIRTIKALLLGGAVMPAGWAHTTTAPLDVRYGSGELNVYNSWQLLTAGQQAHSATATTSSLGGSHTPGTPTSVRPLSGWNMEALTTSATHDAYSDYFVSAPTASGVVSYTLNATLVWNRQSGQSRINNLNLFLYDTTTGNLLMTDSVSTVDSVEQLRVMGLTPGHTYDIQVWKAGGTLPSGVVSAEEIYSLAYSFATNAGPMGSQWGSTAGGTWRTGTNWTIGVPAAAGDTARFAASPGLTSSGTVTLDDNRTVGHLVFDSSTASYTIAASAANSLTIDNNVVGATGVPSIDVNSGTHNLNAPVALADGVVVTVASGAALNVGAAISGSGGLSKAGPGTLTLSAASTYSGNTSVAAGKLVAAQGVNNGGVANPTGVTSVSAGAELDAMNIRQAGLTLDGKATITANGVPGGDSARPAALANTVSVIVTALAVNAAGLLDLNDNDLILKAGAGQSEDSLKALIAAGYGSGQNWSGTAGLTSTAAAANPTYFGLGYGLVSKTLGTSATTFDGQAIAQADLIVKYTYVADLNLDGVVNGNDVIAFAAGYGKGSQWADGNITYHDGVSNGNDVIAFAAAYNSSLGAVPEPGVFVLLGLAGAGLWLLRRRIGKPR